MKRVRKRAAAVDEAMAAVAATGAAAAEMAVVVEMAAAVAGVAGIKDPARPRAMCILRQSSAENCAKT
jgi:hypothetical protein